MAEPVLSRMFWTFLVHGFVTSGASAVVRGWFLICRVQAETDPERRSVLGDETLTFEYLTPHDQPMELDVTSLVPHGTKVDDLSPRKIVEGLTALFATPFRPIPPPPSSLPLHRLPPSQRDKIRAGFEAQRHSAFNHPFGQRGPA